MTVYNSDRSYGWDNTYYCNSFEEAKAIIEYIYENSDLYINDYTKDALNSETIII